MSDDDIRHEGSTKSGRYDSLFGQTLIEYKSPSELATQAKRRLHAKQALRYLDDEEIGANIVILSDGKMWGILRDSQVSPEAGEQPWLDFGDSVPAQPEERFQWRSNSEETARRVLDLLDAVRYDVVTPESLKKNLGTASVAAQDLLVELTASLLDRKGDSRTDTLFRQWLELAGVSYGIERNDMPWPVPHEDVLGGASRLLPNASYAEAVYLLHTYVAICSKLIAAETLALSRHRHERRPSQWLSLSSRDLISEFHRLETGALARDMRATGLMGGDLFGWYADEMSRNKALEKGVRNLLRAFGRLAWIHFAQSSKVAGDVLRDFYVGIVPRQMRRTLGEFFTPEWIAERVVQRSVELSEKANGEPLRFLDPTCGSGTFLVAALRQTLAAASSRGRSPAESAIEALSSVYGFDINPVSPLMARVNLLLALGDLAEGLADIRFNVYQADSILIPEENVGQVRIDEAGSALRVPLVIGNVLLPSSLATLRAIGPLAQVIDDSLQRGRSSDIFARRLAAEFPSMGIGEDEEEEAQTAGVRIYEQLKPLHDEGRDGIWAHVIEQAFAPRIMEQVDIVVGNPPWISWKHLPSIWRDRSELTWRQWGLWQTKRHGGGTPMADISSLLLARCVATYAPNGLVALLLPEGVLLNEPGGRAIRRCLLRPDGASASYWSQRFRPLFVDDFSTLKPFPDASNRPIALYVKAREGPAFPIAVTSWTRAERGVSLPVDQPLRTVLKVLRQTTSELAPIEPRDVASKWRKVTTGFTLPVRTGSSGPGYTWGQGFHTRGADGIFYCEVISDPLPDGLVRIRSRPDLGRNTKGLAQREANVEAEFLWPLLRGANVGLFQMTSSELYCIVPHDPARPQDILSIDQLVSRAPYLYDHLEEHIHRLLARSAYDLKLSSEQPWGIQGTAWRHMHRGAVYVACRYMHPRKRPPAAVCAPESDHALGIDTTRYPNNKVNFVTCRNIAEADYIAAFVNSESAQSMVERMTSTTTIAPSVMNRIAIPQFDADNIVHRRLSSLGAECRGEPEVWRAAADEAEDLVSRLSKTDATAKDRDVGG